MKIRSQIHRLFALLVFGLGLSIVQSVRGQSYTNAPSPLFQYAIFYNGLLELSDCPSLTFNAAVHCNSNIYMGTISGNTVMFNGFVTTGGLITNAPNDGFSQASWVGSNLYNATPAPGWGTGEPLINLSITTNSYRELIKPPPAGESTNNPISPQRYYNKAGLIIMVSNASITLSIKSNPYDATPLVFSNNAPMNTVDWTNWIQAGFTNWLTTNASFYDARQKQTNRVTQIDVGKFGSWIATNTNCLPKWNSASFFNGIIYVADWRDTNGMYMDCVRLTNGQTIPTTGASGASSYPIPGLTVATVNPLYIAGLYNCPSTTNVSSANTSGVSPCSVLCDALTILSPAWKDGNSWIEATGGAIPTASSADTVNTAIIAGNVPSTDSGITNFSGGVQNLPRLLENWSSCTLWLNTSFINLFPSAQATAQFQSPGAYYYAPIRQYFYDPNFNSLTQLPPGTPLLYKYSATVSLTNLSQAYGGTPRNVTALTTPAGLGVNLTYGTNAFAPTNVGNYAVTAVVNDSLYSGFTTNLLVVSKGAAIVTLTNLLPTYDGTAKNVSATTVPSGLTVKLTYNGFNTVPVNAGSYVVVGTVNDTNYQGSVTNTLVIGQAPATVNFTNLSQTYDGTAKTVIATTSPASLTVNVTYNGSNAAPVNVGSYTVVGTITNLNYQGSATNTLLIIPPAPTPITLSGSTILADGTFQLSFTNTPGASFSVLGSADPTAPLADWTVLGNVIEVSPGQFQFTDTQATNVPQGFYIIRSP